MRWQIRVSLFISFVCAHIAAAQCILPHAEFDLGSLNDDEAPRLSVVPIVNTGADTVAIVNVRPGCGCLHAKADVELVLPGDTAVIKVAFSPQGMFGPFDKTVDVVTSESRHRVHIKGDVKMSEATMVRKFPVVVDSLRLSAAEVSFAADSALMMPIRCISAYNGRDVAIVVTKSPAFIRAKPLLDPISPGKMCTILIKSMPGADIKPRHPYPIELQIVDAVTGTPIGSFSLSVKYD